MLSDPLPSPRTLQWWLLQASCCVAAHAMQDAWLSSEKDQLRFSSCKRCFLLPWWMVLHTGWLSIHFPWEGVLVEQIPVCNASFCFPVPSAAGKVPYEHGNWDLVSPEFCFATVWQIKPTCKHFRPWQKGCYFGGMCLCCGGARVIPWSCFSPSEQSLGVNGYEIQCGL